MRVAIVSVTNDLTTDQRVDRSCRALQKAGYDVLLVGRRLRNSKSLAPRSYQMHRMRLLFDTGPLFYAEYNTALFFYLLFHHASLLFSNDLDTLPANYLAARLKWPFRNRQKTKSRIRHVHDCHEYFRGVPELNGRKTVIRIWKWIEDRIFPKLSHVVAVNQSIADLYTAEYGNAISVVRNVPVRKASTGMADRSLLQIGPAQKIILYQGAVNVDRGIEEAILAMKYLRTSAILIIAGVGDVFEDLQKFTKDQGLAEKVRFLGQVPFQELHSYTLMADLGLSIEKDVSINYHYCLPNKFLDYIQANVPVLVSPFPEMKAIVDRYMIGAYIGSHDPAELAAQIDALFDDPQKMAGFKHNLLKAADDLCWEAEEGVLMKVLGSTVTS